MIYKSYLVEQNFDLITQSLVLFYGENLGLKNDYKIIIRSNFKNSEIITLLQEDIIKDESSFFDKVLNYSLFEQEKVFIINNATEKIMPIIQKIEQKKIKQKIYLFSDILEKKNKLRSYYEKSQNTGIIPCYPDVEASLKIIIEKKLKNFKNLTSQNINLIIENTNLDRVKLYNELNKIITYFENRKIETSKLSLLLNNEESDDFNNLRDEALNGNKIKTNKLISRTILEKEKSYLYLNSINQRLKILNEINELKKKVSLENAINSFKPPIFWKDKPILLAQIKKWNIKKVKKILDKIYKMEIKMKSNSFINSSLLLKYLLMDICVLANS